MIELDTIKAILKEDLPKSVVFIEKREIDCLMILFWTRENRYFKKKVHPVRFNMWIYGDTISLYMIKSPNIIKGSPSRFELADPDCWRQILDLFAKEWTL